MGEGSGIAWADFKNAKIKGKATASCKAPRYSGISCPVI